MKPEISLRIFDRTSNAKFHENPPSGSQIVLCGQRDGLTDKYGEDNIRFWQFLHTRERVSYLLLRNIATVGVD